MRLQLNEDANFRVLEQFANPSTGVLKTSGTVKLRIFHVVWCGS
jgi:hypothetical protein